jgi:hypothetical protein
MVRPIRVPSEPLDRIACLGTWMSWIRPKWLLPPARSRCIGLRMCWRADALEFERPRFHRAKEWISADALPHDGEYDTRPERARMCLSSVLTASHVLGSYLALSVTSILGEL